MSSIHYSVGERQIATITFNRDEKRNAFDSEMVSGVLKSLAQAEREGARVVVLRANAGAQVWCAGQDLAELDPDKIDDNPMIAIFNKIQTLTVPVIAMVEGSVHGGGLIILLGADIVVADENADVAITSNKLGIPLPPEAYAYWLRVMGIHKTKELLFTAASISAADAKTAGLYNHVVAAAELESKTNEVAEKILLCSPLGLANTKSQLNLLAQQTALTDGDRQRVDEGRATIVNSDEIRSRISELLASLGQ